MRCQDPPRSQPRRNRLSPAVARPGYLGIGSFGASLQSSCLSSTKRGASFERQAADRVISRSRGLSGILPASDTEPGYLRFPFRSARGFVGLGDSARAAQLGIAPSYPLRWLISPSCARKSPTNLDAGLRRAGANAGHGAHALAACRGRFGGHWEAALRPIRASDFAVVASLQQVCGRPPPALRGSQHSEKVSPSFRCSAARRLA